MNTPDADMRLAINALLERRIIATQENVRLVAIGVAAARAHAATGLLYAAITGLAVLGLTTGMLLAWVLR